MAATELDEATIFDTARRIESASVRYAYVDQTCGNNSALKARVEALLRVYEEPDFLTSPPIGPDGDEDRVAEGPGTQIGPYKLLEQIGEGGFGIVFTAEQRQPLRRTVALKILKPGMDTRQVLARFEMERQALALMDHPNIARIFDGGQTGSGRPYFVMELVKGVPITRYCDENGLAPRERLVLFVAVCDAVQHAHQKGIIHRDLKPTNVLIAAYDGKPAVKVIDFGVAKALGEGLTERTLVTGFGGIIGTLEYMSPEQAEFNARDVDTRADIYCLGVLLYELLTGTTPLARERLEQTGMTETLRLIREEQPQRPSTRLSTLKQTLTTVSEQRRLDPIKLKKQVRGDLDWIVMKALEKDRNRRYPTAGDFAEDVRRYLRAEAIIARPPSASYRLKIFARKNCKLLIAAGAFIALLSLGTAVSSWLAIRASLAEQAASRERDRADAEAKQAERHLYAAHMNLAQAAWEDDRVGRLASLLAQHRPPPGHDDLRGFEWFYWDRLANTPLLSLTGHKYRIVCVAYSPDGKLVASGSQDQTAKIWDLATGRELHTLAGHGGYVIGVAFSPDGEKIATASGDSTIKLWDTESGQELRTLRGHKNWVSGVAFSPEGSRLASASHDHTLKLWNLQDGEQRTFEGHKALVTGVAFSPDGRYLASSSTDTTVKLWDIATTGEIGSMDGHAGETMAVAFSPNGDMLASASHDRTVKLWSVSTKQCQRTLEGHKERVFGVAFSPNGRRIASASVDQTVKLWEAATGDELYTLKGHSSWVSSVAFSPDGSRLASASDDHTVKVWDAITGQEAMIKLRGGESVLTVAFSPDGQHIASAGHEPYIAVWDAASRLREHKLQGHTGEVRCVTFSHDGSRLASAAADKMIKIWEFNPVQPKRSWQMPTHQAFALAFSPNDKLLATASEDNLVRLWDAHTGELKLVLAGHTKPARSVAFHPDGRQLASSGLDHTIKIWDLITGREKQTLNGHAAGPTGVASVAYSPDGKMLASGSADKTVKIWDIASGRELWTLPGHSDWVSSVAFSPDGKRLASASADKTIKMWDTASGQETLTLRGHSSLVLGLAFPKDGQRLVSAGFDGIVGLWDARPWGDRVIVGFAAADSARAYPSPDALIGR